MVNTGETRSFYDEKLKNSSSLAGFDIERDKVSVDPAIKEGYSSKIKNR